MKKPRPQPGRKHAAPARAAAPPPSRSGNAGWIALIAILAVVAVVAWLYLKRDTRPHAFVLVSIDTLRADRLPTYGYTAGQTPALTRFAGESVVFDHAYAHAPQTLPSHASMFTGLLPFEHRVRDNMGFTLAAGQSTMASLFASAGYRTAGFASAYVLRPDTGISQGFSVFDAALPAASGDQAPAEIFRPGPDTLTATTTWLKTLADDRFFLFFHIYEPHAPYTPPSRFTLPDKYDGEVAFSDEIVGQLFAWLRERGWYDDATIVVTADHGEGLGDHQEKEHGLFVYQETIHVPLMVKLPGGRRGGTRLAPPVQHIDLLPTFAALAGFSSPAGLRGRNLQPLLTGSGTITPQGIYSEAMYPRYHFGWSELTSLVDERYKFIKAPKSELYDLERDPRERTNIITDRAQAATALRSGLEALIANRNVDAPSAVSAEDRERLAALGYIGTHAPMPVTTRGETLPDPKDKAGILVTYREAVDLISARQFEPGMAKLRQVLADNPDMIDAWLTAAATYSRIGRSNEALDAYREAIRRKPDETGALLGASSLLSSMNRLDEARKYAELAIAGAPASAHQTLANIALLQHRPDDALREADLAAKADPMLPTPALVRGMIEYNAERYREALPYLMQAREMYQKRTLQARDLNFYIADSLARLERYADAEPFFQEELKFYPQNTRARAGLALLYQSMGRPADAERTIQEMLRSSPSPLAYDRAEYLYNLFGDRERAAAIRAAARAKFGGGK